MMNTKELMAGIAVVIDDKLGPESTPGVVGGSTAADQIHNIVEWFEREWALSFVKSTSLPSDAHWPNLLRAASFVLLDWRLWGDGGDELKRRTIADIVRFLKCARESLVPVFIFTNEVADDVVSELPPEVYEEAGSGRSFVFVGRKDELWSGESVKVETLGGWAYGNASVYVLRTWEKHLDAAKAELFRRMRDRSVDWPRVFWRSYEDDHADPSASLTSLINDSLTGRMRMDGFEKEHLGGEHGDVAGDELRGLIAEASFRPEELLPRDEVRSGDLYKRDGKKYLLNLRPDCDCIPRNGRATDGVSVHCIEGERLGPAELRKLYKDGHFEERVFQSVVFAVANGDSILFDFGRLMVMQYGDVKARRVGRLLHPYVTRIQQRYALHGQRQALPRIPEAAVPRALWRRGTLKTRRKLVAKDDYYHSVPGGNVWHSDPKCAAGKRIWSHYLRGGQGDMAAPCRLCKV